MSQVVKRGRAQLQLPLQQTMLLAHPLEQVRGEVIDVVADLLLEAMGTEDNESVQVKEAGDEYENHA